LSVQASITNSSGIPAHAVACFQAPLRFGLLRRRPSAPSRPLMRDGDGLAVRRHCAGTPLADPSPIGQVASLPPLFVPAHF
jgi:hypothetical protein